jgi:predicted RNA-binding protein with PUA-like domain
MEQFNSPISLEIIIKNKAISHLPLIKQSRLSVMPIDYKSWKIIYKMGKIKKI